MTSSVTQNLNKFGARYFFILTCVKLLFKLHVKVYYLFNKKCIEVVLFLFEYYFWVLYPLLLIWVGESTNTESQIHCITFILISCIYILKYTIEKTLKTLVSCVIPFQFFLRNSENFFHIYGK